MIEHIAAKFSGPALVASASAWSSTRRAAHLAYRAAGRPTRVGRRPSPRDAVPRPVARPPLFSPDLGGSTSNARPARLGSSYGLTRSYRPHRHACRPRSNGLGRRDRRRPHRPNALRTHDRLASQAPRHPPATAKQAPVRGFRPVPERTRAGTYCALVRLVPRVREWVEC